MTRAMIPTVVALAFLLPSKGLAQDTCATTSAYHKVSCQPDIGDARSHLVELLTNSEPDDMEWRTRVGLSNVDPAGLVLVEDDSICTTLWNVVWARPPHVGGFVAFFQLGDVFIVTEYPNADSDLGPVSLGRAFTAVVNQEFEVQGHILAE